MEARDVPATVYALLDTNVLVSFDSASPSTITDTINVTGLQANETLVGIDFRPRTGQLIGSAVDSVSTTSSSISTYRIDLQTGQATLIGTTATNVTGAGNVATGYDFNPTVDRIRFVNDNDLNIRLNPNDGSLAATDTNLNPLTVEVIAAAYDRSFDRASTTIPTTLFVINRATSSLAVQGSIDGTVSPNGGLIVDIGSLGFTLDSTVDGGFDIAFDPSVSFALNNNGLGRALAALTDDADGLTRLYEINLATGAATPIGLIGSGSSEIFSMAIVPSSAVVVGSGLGANGDVRLLNGDTGAIRQSIIPFEGFQGGVRVAAGDVTGDGYADIVVSAIAPQGHVKVFNGLTGELVYSFFAFEGFQGTVNVASGDVNGDGFDDILVVANGANGHVKVFSGQDGSLLASYFAYEGFMGDVSIAAADFNLDGNAEIVTVAALNGHAKVFAADGSLFTSTTLPGFVNSFLIFEGFLGPVYVAAGDLNGDGTPDIAAASGPNTVGHVRAFSGRDGASLASFFTPDVTFRSGPPVQIASLGAIGVADVNADGRYEIVVTPAPPTAFLPGNNANVTAYGLDGLVLTSLTAFDTFLGGVTVSGTRG